MHTNGHNPPRVDDALRARADTHAAEHTALLARLARLSDLDGTTAPRTLELRADTTPLTLGDVAVAVSYRRWRYGIVTGLTKTRVTVALVTASGLDEAQRYWTRRRAELTADGYAETQATQVWRHLAEVRDRCLATTRRDRATYVRDSINWERVAGGAPCFAESRQRATLGQQHDEATAWLAKHSERVLHARFAAAYLRHHAEAHAARVLTRTPWVVNASLVAGPHPRTQVFAAPDVAAELAHAERENLGWPQQLATSSSTTGRRNT